ncbi:MAG: NUDIX hydrolase [Thermoanaerobaculia bacterium]
MSTEETRTRPDWHYVQSAVIPYRQRRGGIEVLLITSRKRKRWVLPKGIREPYLSPAESAAKEAMEEAGVAGRVSAGPVGRYEYRKWGGTCSVEVFTMQVERVHDRWPEEFRERSWLTPEEAAARVEEAELGQLLRAAARRIESTLADSPK